MSNKHPSTAGAHLQAHKLSRKKAAESAAARRMDEDARAARRGRILALCAAALDNGNAIDGGGKPPTAGDTADALIQWRAALADNGRAGWVDVLEGLDATPLRRSILGFIRDASPNTRRATARLLKAELSDPQLACEFWYELNSIGGVFWDWLQDDVPEAGPPAPQAYMPDAGLPANPPAGTSGEAHERKKKPKRSTENGEARAKIIAALSKHHQYEHGSCLHLTPIGNNELANIAEVSPSTASAFFKERFKGHGRYRAVCQDGGGLTASLKLLRGEFSPHLLYGKDPDNKEGPDDE